MERAETFILVPEGWAHGVGCSVRRLGGGLGSFSLLLSCPQMSPHPSPTPLAPIKTPLGASPWGTDTHFWSSSFFNHERERSRLILLAGHLEKEQVVCEAWPACPGLDSGAATRTLRVHQYWNPLKSKEHLWFSDEPQEGEVWTQMKKGKPQEKKKRKTTPAGKWAAFRRTSFLLPD